jgi:hypothetical protein
MNVHPALTVCQTTVEKVIVYRKWNNAIILLLVTYVMDKFALITLTVIHNIVIKIQVKY